MSILSSTHTGKKFADFLVLYNKHEQFYEEIVSQEKETNKKWDPTKSKVYSQDDLLFLISYHREYSITDEEFLNKLVDAYYDWKWEIEEEKEKNSFKYDSRISAVTQVETYCSGQIARKINFDIMKSLEKQRCFK